MNGISLQAWYRQGSKKRTFEQTGEGFTSGNDDWCENVEASGLDYTTRVPECVYSHTRQKHNKTYDCYLYPGLF